MYSFWTFFCVIVLLFVCLYISSRLNKCKFYYQIKYKLIHRFVFFFLDHPIS
jgi:hypothetical protein